MIPVFSFFYCPSSVIRDTLFFYEASSLSVSLYLSLDIFLICWRGLGVSITDHGHIFLKMQVHHITYVEIISYGQAAFKVKVDLLPIQ